MSPRNFLNFLENGTFSFPLTELSAAAVPSASSPATSPEFSAFCAISPDLLLEVALTVALFAMDIPAAAPVTAAPATLAPATAAFS